MKGAVLKVNKEVKNKDLAQFFNILAKIYGKI